MEFFLKHGCLPQGGTDNKWNGPIWQCFCARVGGHIPPPPREGFSSFVQRVVSLSCLYTRYRSPLDFLKIWTSSKIQLLRYPQERESFENHWVDALRQGGRIAPPHPTSQTPYCKLPWQGVNDLIPGEMWQKIFLSTFIDAKQKIQLVSSSLGGGWRNASTL